VRIALWLFAYFIMVFGPLFLLVLAPRPPQREFWRDFSVGLGFAALTLLGLQFVPTGRIPALSTLFPLDTLYRFHHRISVLAWILALAHPVILFVNNPYTLRLLDIFSAPWRARAALVAVVAMTFLVVSSVWRRKLAIVYEPWRGSHAVAAILATVLAFYHMLKVNYYSASPFQRIFWIGLALVWAAFQVYVRLIKPWLLTRHPYVLAELIPERGDSVTLSLNPVGHSGMTFRPGQVAWLTIGQSPFGIREHPFSMTSSAEHPERLEFTVRSLGDFTSQLGGLAPGERVYVDGAYGTFDATQSDATAYALIAGGIGSAPMMSILRTMADRGDERPVILFYGNWSWDSITFREELDVLEERLNLNVVHVLEMPPEGWDGEVGYVTADVLDRHLPPERNEYIYFICGPLPMLGAVRRALRQLRIPLSRIHSEEYDMA